MIENVYDNPLFFDNFKSGAGSWSTKGVNTIAEQSLQSVASPRNPVLIRARNSGARLFDVPRHIRTRLRGVQRCLPS